jgi:hypothetical protein
MGMSPDNSLLFGIVVDPSPGTAAVANFQKQVAELNAGLIPAWESSGKAAQVAGEAAAAGSEQAERAILNQRESVRLLGEEFGIHLPRAVSSAVARMLPDVAMVGTGLLGIFAVEQVVSWGEKAVAEVRELQGATKELEGYWKSVVAEQEQLLRNFKTSAEGASRIADTVRELSDVRQHIQGLNKELQELPPGAALAAIAIAHQLNQWEAKEKELYGRLQAQHLEQAAVVKQEYKDEETGANEAAEQVLAAERKKREGWERTTEQQYEYWAKRREEDNRYWQEQIREFDIWSAAEDQKIARLREEEIWRSKNTQAFAQENAEMLKGISVHELSNRLLHQARDECERL